MISVQQNSDFDQTISVNKLITAIIRSFEAKYIDNSN